MESPTHRHRNLTVLVLVLVVQLLLLGYQVRDPENTRLVRVWAVTAITPAAKVLETTRRGVSSLLEDYVFLAGVRQENRRLQDELDELKIEAHYLRSELATAERASALSAFRALSPSRTVAARIVGASPAADSRVVYIDRGTNSGVAAGMAVITPDGIVGKIRAAYPTASQAVLITDPGFAAGVVSQNNQVQGTLKGRGDSLCFVDHVQNEETIEAGEWFYTSGDDRVFPRGLPVGQIQSVNPGQELQQILVEPIGLRGGLEEVLVVIEAVHGPIPEESADAQESPVMLPPPDTVQEQAGDETRPGDSGLATEADRVADHYRRVGEAQGHSYGMGEPGSRPPNFNLDPDEPPAQATPRTSGSPSTSQGTDPQTQ